MAPIPSSSRKRLSVPERSSDDREAHRRDRQTRLAQQRAWFAIAALFLINGFTLASWISRLPTITGRLELSPGQVGTVLMTLAAGAIVAFPLAGRLIETRSSGRPCRSSR